MSIAWKSSPVPPEWRGLWRRLALQRSDGTTDTTSLVLWIQTERAYVDLRIPLDRNGTEGFAGHLDHAGQNARWIRTIDCAPTGQPDEGHLTRERRIMTEHGLHDPYIEHWWLEDTATPETLTDTATHITVRAGNHLLLARTQNATCEVSHAQRVADGWRIQNSTLPCREGALLAAQDLQPTAPNN